MLRWATCRSPTARRFPRRTSPRHSRISRRRCRVPEGSEMTSHKPKFVPTALLAATTLVVAACGGGSRDDTPPPAAANYPPTATAIADRTSDQDTVVGPIAFDVADAESD